jgi:hypothetical protein
MWIKRRFGVWELTPEDEKLYVWVSVEVGEPYPADVFAQNLERWRKWRRRNGFSPVTLDTTQHRPFFDDACFYWGLAKPRVALEEMH